MKIALVLLFLQGCVSTTDTVHIKRCADFCRDKQGLYEIGVNIITKSKCCKCIDGEKSWLNL